jgi:hypothetical protein
MAKSKFKTGDRVRIVTNALQPQFNGKTAVVKKVYQSTENDEDFFYRLSVGEETLKGVATDNNIAKL